MYEFPALTSIGKGSARVPSQGGFVANASIVVEGNPLLFYCCGLSRFFSGRSNPASGGVYIGNNSTGCDSEEEISCDIFDQPLTDTLRLPFHTTDTTFIIHSQTRWKLSQDGTEADWITGLSSGGNPVTDSLMGDQTASITVTYAQNGTAESRTARLRISFLDTMGGELTSPMPYTLTLIQEEVMPTLQPSPSTVNVSDLSGNTNITLTANNVKWRLRKDSVADWITMLSVGATNRTDTLIVNNNDFVPTDTVVTITYEELPISLTNRRALLVLESIDDEGNMLDNVSPITITFTQMVPSYMGDITLTTQQAVDTIRNTLGNPRVTAIVGNLIIGASSDITHLDSLRFLTEITENFEIGRNGDTGGVLNGNSALVDIGDFPFLQKIGGGYYVTQNTNLVSGGNFPVLDSIGGYFFIRDNDKLEGVGNFPRLKDIGTYVSIRSNGNLRSLYDFPALTSIGMGSAWVPSSNSGNGSTVSGVSIVVEDNPLLFYCCTLTKFRSGGSNPVSGTIYINNNSTGCSSAGQANCNPFLGLSVDRDTVASSSLETSFILTANTRWRLSKLNSETNWITSFSAENMTERDSLTGGQNDSLLTSTSVTINYNQNFISEDSLTERLLVSLLDETGEALTSPAPDTFTIVRHMIVRQRNQLYIGNISVSNQADVDALGVSGGALEGSITKIMGNVTISGSITDLSIFNNIDTITGYLRAEGLTQLRALSQDTSGSGDYVGFTNLKMIGDYFLVGDSSSSTNSSLDSVGYFPHLDSVGGYFQIRNNASLDAMGSFPVLRSIGADFSVQDNDQLLHIPDFDSLIRVGQNFGILSHDTLATIGSFPKLKTIGGYYQISSNDSLVNVGDFPALQTIGGTFYVTNNDTLTTLGNFPQLMSIGTNDNDSVNIPSEGRNISNVSVVIESNTNLSNCQTLTDFLLGGVHAVSGGIYINNNALGCSSGDEIKASAPHTIMLTSHTDGDSIAIAYDEVVAQTIMFSIGGGATGWTSDITGDNFITLDTDMNVAQDTGIVITVTATPTENTGVERSATIRITTTGGTGAASTFTVTITQAAAPPMLLLTSDATVTLAHAVVVEQTIRFTVGGSASGWSSSITYTPAGANFIILDPDMNTDQRDVVVVEATPSANTGAARSAMITFTTEGGTGAAKDTTVTITQSAAPPIFILTSDSAETVAYGAESASDITFNVGGGATGWWAGVIDRDDDTNDFVTLSKSSGSAGLDTIEVTTTVNTGETRVDTVVVGTGGEGEATDTIIVTQEAIPTISLTTPSDSMIVIDYNEVTETITFEVGGSATDWTASSDQSFVTLDITSGASGTGLMATVTENRDVQRTATITITTEGQLGEARTATVMITQTGAPNSPTLSVATPSGATTVAYTTDSVEIMFTTANATGWESVISYGDGAEEFVTLTGNPLDTGEVTVKAAVTGNIGVERSAKIVFSTTGTTGGGSFSSAKDSLTITQAGAPPIFTLTSGDADTTAYGIDTLDIIFEVGGGASGWDAEVIDRDDNANNFVTLVKTSGSAGSDTIKVAVSKNTGLSRIDTIKITTDGGTGDAKDTTVTITQSAAPPTLLLTSPSTVTLAHDVVTEQTITFTVGGGASGWTSSVSGNNFITISEDGTMTGDVTVTATPSANTGVERSVMITFTTDGGTGTAKDTTVMITQSAAPPSLVLTSPSTVTLAHDVVVAQTITFTVGGSASGWTSAITGENFITLADDGARTGDVVVTATPSANTGVERSAMITFTTDGGTGSAKDTTVTITQSAAPPSLVLTSPSTVTLAHDVTDAQTIMFTVGGSASGWTSAITGENFITLSDDGATTGDVVVTATPSANTGVERSVMITFTTDGGTGAAKDTTVTITQGGAPPTLLLTSDATVTLAHDVDAAQTITFTVGGGASGWTSSMSGDDFIMLSDDGATTGDVVVTATLSGANAGVERSTMITFTTMGGTGDAATATVTITQSAAPPTLLLTSDAIVTLDHSVTMAQTIRFTVGGGASGWTSSMSGENFIILANDGATTGDVVVTATLSGANTGVERSTMITFTTMGGTGDAATATVTITQSAAPPTLLLTSDAIVTLDHDVTDAQTIRFTVGGGASGWTSSMSGDDFIMLSDDGATTGDVVVTATLSGANAGVERSAVITFTTMGGTGVAEDITVMITQSAAPPSLLLTSDATVTLAHDVVAAQTITFTVGGSASGWTSSMSGDNFIMLSDDGVTTGDVTVTATPSSANISNAARSAVITFTTDGGTGTAATAMVTITQGVAGAPTLLLTSPSTVPLAHDVDVAQTITFTVGDATGWTSAITGDDFITLTDNGATEGDVVVTATPSGANTGVERSTMITFTTTGGVGDPATAVVTITQGGAVPTLLLTSDATVTLAHDVDAAQTITFTVGGGASGWTSSMSGDDFIMLSDDGATTGDVVVTATLSGANAGVERSTMITFTTMGGTGVAKDITVMITQEAAPPTLVLTSPSTVTLDHDVTMAQTIAFTVGGGASGWTSSMSGDNFIMLSDDGATTGDVVVTATLSGANAGVERSAVITFTTEDGTGDAATATVTITQSAAPPTLLLTSDATVTLDHDVTMAQTIAFTVGGGASGWTSSMSGDDFIMLSDDGATTGDVVVTATLSGANAGVERSAVITFTTMGGTGVAEDITVMITQSAAPPSLVLTSPSTVTLAHDVDVAQTIRFTVGGGASGWTSSMSGDDFIMLSDDGATTGDVVVTATLSGANTGAAARSAVITFTTDGGTGTAATATVMITQGVAGAPTLLLTSSFMVTLAHDVVAGQMITFTVGDATGWTSEITGDDFITLTDDGAMEGDVVVTATPSGANTGVERSAMITFTTMGGTGDAATAVVTITQSAAPPMFTLTSGDAETIAHSAESATDITFTVGGGATGWTSSIAYTPELALGASGFITLTPDNGERGDVVVTVVSTMNTMSVERSAVITFTTMGGTGDAATSVVTLTQSAPVVTPDPVTLMVSTFEDTTINDESGSLSISFTLGGTAKGWTSAGADFITLTPSESTSDTNTAVTVVAAYEANTGVERTDTIVFTTTGGVTDMITITQAAAPPTLMVSTFEDTTINDEEGSLDITFTLGGTAKGWTSAVKGADFITLDPAMSASDTNTAVTVMATYEANTGVERTDTIVFTTGDVADTIVITQSAGPPIFTLTSDDDETIAHDAEAASDITFNVGGGATGWWAGVIDRDEDTNDFVTLE